MSDGSDGLVTVIGASERPAEGQMTVLASRPLPFEVSGTPTDAAAAVSGINEGDASAEDVKRILKSASSKRPLFIGLGVIGLAAASLFGYT